MPTTRYGRFKFFKRRALRRLAKIKRRSPYAGDGGAAAPTSGGSRRYDLSEFTKQMPKEYPKGKVGSVVPQVPGGQAEFIAGTYGRLPVYRWDPAGTGADPPTNHSRGQRLGYVARRVKSVPRLKYIPRYGYEFTPAQVAAGNHFPFPTYQSGRLNPNVTPPL